MTPRELPELPRSTGNQIVMRGDDYQNDYVFHTPAYTADQMHAYARQAIAKSEARAEGLRDAVRKMHEADAAYGCGFYNQVDWLEAYELTAQIAGVNAAIAQEAEREAGSA